MKLNQFSLVKKKTNIESEQIGNSEILNTVARKFYDEDLEIYESVFVMYLNNSNKAIGFVKLSQGGLTSSVIDVRICCLYAVKCLCTSAILVHNHPSGERSPSPEDKSITQWVKNSLQFFNIKLLDHIILTPETDKYFSFADEDMI